MVLTFQIILLFIILGTGVKATTEKEDKELRGTFLAVFILANMAFIVSVMLL